MEGEEEEGTLEQLLVTPVSGAGIVLDKAVAGTPAADVLLASFIGTVLVVWAMELAEHVTFSNPAP
ncbi:hypothetical protein [Kribbella caucasensis]|uniref:hypothetical protein n=1 Tax=Kribbella caucasensis TaxID=2512215 RepID=UPI0021030F7F|nr:hypothetical protein [Kribbella sp. VKM Ac-2527]